MTVSIMQPYYYPYIGYFQLIKSCDIFVNLEHVSFKKRSYMTRNILKDSQPINLRVQKASQNKNCLDTKVLIDENFNKKFLKKIAHLYSKTKNYDFILNEIITPTINNHSSISDYNISIIKKICHYLEIKTKIVNTSANLTELKKENGIVEIVKKLNCNVYINPINGVEIYNKNFFKHKEIDLYFIKMNTEQMTISNPYISILDLLFCEDKEKIIYNLNCFSLI